MAWLGEQLIWRTCLGNYFVIEHSLHFHLEQIKSLKQTQWQMIHNIKTTSQNVIYDTIIQTPICFNAVIVFTVLWFPWQLNFLLRIMRENDIETWFDVFSTGLVRLNSIIYPLLVIRYHRKLRTILVMYIPECHCELR